MVDRQVERILQLTKGFSARQKMQLIQSLSTTLINELAYPLPVNPQRVVLPTDELTYKIDRLRSTQFTMEAYLAA